MDDKANLRQLSNCLNQASSLINTILAGEERPDPPSTPRQLNQRQPEQRRPESVSPAVSSEASTSASTSQHVNVVASAVNRARLMIQQSSSKGLYSRLGKKERLRATSSKPAQDSKTKRPHVEIRNKVFEFVLLQLDECDDKDALVFSDNMVALRGFIETTTQASEKDIRCKLGEAIRLKFPLVTDKDFEFVRANRRRISKPVSVGEYNYQQIKLLAGQGCIYLKMKDGFDCVLVEEDPEDSSFDFEKKGEVIIYKISLYYLGAFQIRF